MTWQDVAMGSILIGLLSPFVGVGVWLFWIIPDLFGKLMAIGMLGSLTTVISVGVYLIRVGLKK